MNKIAVLSQEELREVIVNAVREGVGMALASEKRSQPEEMTEEQAGEYLGGISPHTLRSWRVQKRGPKYHKNGKLVRYAKSDLNAWMETNGVLTMDSLEMNFGKSR